ncbi:MAG: hypothetical protein KME11_00370 [Timaviella obliquedivisa GSE-PSE-MK23-08B]|jgi:hypothetical protein|nr:hypothetical protein [Timaviella obliquedivisa GSE-PSE-MK23-08B]
MKQEAIQNFLNLPGLGGVALLNGRSRPYFHGFCQALNDNQRKALAQGIQQVVDTTPADFESFEFCFSDHQIHVYKLDYGVTLLVVMHPSQVQADYYVRIEEVKNILKAEEDRAIATFQTLAAQSIPSKPAALSQSLVTFIQPPKPTISLKEALTAINHFSKLAVQYLGTIVVTNYWKTSRPEADWMQLFQVERSAEVVFLGQAIADSLALTLEQHELLQTWVSAFIKRCSKVIRDFPKRARQMPLSDRQKTILPPE